MKTIHTAYVIPLLLLSACSSRQTGQISNTGPVSNPEGIVQAAAAPVAEPAEPAPPPPVQPSVQPPAQPVQPQVQSIPSGTLFHVRLDQTLDTGRNRAGDRFFATLVEPVSVGGNIVIPNGARFTGHLIDSKPSGRFKGRALLSLSLDSFERNGRNYDISTTRVARASGGHKKRNWILIGGGSGFGSAVGAIAAGPVGALVGAGSGAAAGTAGAAFTGKKNVHLPVETQLAFALRSSVSMR